MGRKNTATIQRSQESKDNREQTKEQPQSPSKETTDKKQADLFEAGYNFGDMNKGKTPWDYLFKIEQDGKITQNGTLVRGWKVYDLRDGIELDRFILPPLLTWNGGFWLTDLYEELDKHKPEARAPWAKKIPQLPAGLRQKYMANRKESYCMWVVTGEGVPGAWACLGYIVPEEYAGQMSPKHPRLWLKEDFNYKGTKDFWKYIDSYVQDWGGTSTTTQQKPAISAAPKGPSMPFSVRFRCTGCGHWYKEADLAGHTKFVCPGSDGTNHDWAMMCCDECGCQTLDEAATCKPGFPRKVEAKEVKEESQSDSPQTPASATT